MKQSLNSRGLKAAILTMSFIQMATNAVSSILADIAAEFPAASVSAIQYLMTFPNLLVVIVSVLSAKLSVRFSKRTLASVGLVLACLSGMLSFLFHENLPCLYVWAGMLGTGIGLAVPIANSLISDYFDGSEKDTLLGYQTSAANVGSMLMTFFGGLIAVWGWYYDYLVYFLAVPGLALTLIFVPQKNVKTENKGEASENRKKGIPGFAWRYFFIAAVFMLMFYMGPTNLAMIAGERSIGKAAAVGTAATLLLLGGSVMGMIFGRIAGKIGEYTIPLGFGMLFLGYMIIYAADSIGLFYLGSFLVGTSNTLVLPQCMGQMVTEDKEQSTFLMSVVLAAANFGTFLAPVLTGLSAFVMGNDLAGSRFLFTGIISAVAAVVSGIAVHIEH